MNGVPSAEMTGLDRLQQQQQQQQQPVPASLDRWNLITELFFFFFFFLVVVSSGRSLFLLLPLSQMMMDIRVPMRRSRA